VEMHQLWRNWRLKFRHLGSDFTVKLPNPFPTKLVWGGRSGNWGNKSTNSRWPAETSASHSTTFDHCTSLPPTPSLEWEILFALKIKSATSNQWLPQIKLAVVPVV
jgi:hypothetical protein